MSRIELFRFYILYPYYLETSGLRCVFIKDSSFMASIDKGAIIRLYINDTKTLPLISYQGKE